MTYLLIKLAYVSLLLFLNFFHGLLFQREYKVFGTECVEYFIHGYSIIKSYSQFIP